MKNRLILSLVRALRKPTKPGPLNQRILVVSTTALGDALWATPALESLRTSFPHAYLALLTSPIGEQTLRHNPWVDRTFVLQEPLLPRFFSLWKMLKREAFDTIVILHASQRLILPLCALLGAQRIVGTAGINKHLDELLTSALPRKPQHEIIRRLELIEHIGATRSTETLSFFLQPAERLPDSKPFSILHPGSKDAFRRWPAEHFIAVGKQLAQHGHQILITGTPSELPLMQQIAAQIPNAQLSDPTLSVRSFAALLERADLLIANDTGPVHLACALNTPVIALYAASLPSLFGPHKAPRGLAIAKRIPCQPCLKRTCRRPFCMLQIGPEEVIQAALKISGR